MRRRKFLEQTLGIDRPWYVENAELDRTTGVFSVQLNFEEGGRRSCPGRGPGAGSRGAWRSSWRRWRLTCR